MNPQEELYSKLPTDKIKISRNKNPIETATFLSFLTVPVVRSREHLGSCNGWTLYLNEELKLRITGGIVNGVEYLDHILFGERLANPYNNYVNPFYLFGILNNDGHKFFIDYYKDDIVRVISEAKGKMESAKKKFEGAKLEHKNMVDAYETNRKLSGLPLKTHRPAPGAVQR